VQRALRRRFARLAITGCTIAALVAASAPAGASADTAPPTLAGVAVSPPTVDATTLAKSVTVTITARDDTSGFAAAGMRFHAPGGGTYVYAGFGAQSRTAGTALDGTYTRLVVLPGGAALGTWTVDAIDLVDEAGNAATITAAQLASSGLTASVRNEPAQATPLPPPAPSAVLVANGTVRVQWGTPASSGMSPISSFRVTAAPGGTSAVVAGTARSGDVSGLDANAAYTFTVSAANAFGEGPASVASPAVFVPQWDVQAPTDAAISTLPDEFALTPSIRVGWGASDASGIRSYDVQVRSARWSNVPGSWTTWKARSTDESATYEGTPGYSYCFRVRAEDKAANVSGWSSPRCTSLPMTADSFTYTPSFTRYSPVSGYAQTAYWSSRAGARAKRTMVYGERIALVTVTCPECGVASITWNGVEISRLNLYAPTKSRKQVFTVATWSTPREGTLAVDVVSEGKFVIVEGLGVYQS
jgi:hypothetical protein